MQTAPKDKGQTVGRQLSIIATDRDEAALLDFLRQSADIAIFASFAWTTEALWVEHFAEDRKSHGQYYVWNKTFPWQPEYRQVKVKSGSMAGWYYVANEHNAPVIEISRSGGVRKEGRIYWAKFFSAPEGLEYDFVKFEEWFDTIVRWIRRVGRKRAGGRFEPYYLPDAFLHAASVENSRDPHAPRPLTTDH
jgi:hypothetical protein